MSFGIIALLIAQASSLSGGASADVTAPAISGDAMDLWKPEAVPEPLSDSEACAMFGRISEETMREVPIRVNEKTYVLKSAVDCPAKVYYVNEEVQVSVKDFEANWRQQLQEDLNLRTCDNIMFLPLIWAGWHFQRRVTLISGVKFEIEAHCD